MSLHVTVEPMPNNPARQSRLPDSSGQWRVVVKESVLSHTADDDRALPQIHSEDLSYDQAFMLANRLQTELIEH